WLPGSSPPPAGPVPGGVPGVEMPLIEMALEATGGNQVKCAKLLGINRNTLRKKIGEQDIRVTRLRKKM
ncbi:MAG: nitrogen regulation protein NR(I), partial [Roseovarius sp.]|nr:nitrogen regulation protein NR(I) [Roseovarius sp.]